jgi:hypothetical protein
MPNIIKIEVILLYGLNVAYWKSCWCFLHRKITGSIRLRVSSSEVILVTKNIQIYPSLNPIVEVIAICLVI